MKLLAIIVCLSFCCSSYADIKRKLIVTQYDISASTIPQLLQQILIHGPKSSGDETWALLRSDINAEFHFRSDNKGCHLMTDSIAVLGEIVVPRWLNVETAPAKIQRWWGDFVSFLLDHESLHYQGIVQHASMLNNALDNLTPASDCNILRIEYLKLKHQMLNRIAQADFQIDRQSKSKKLNLLAQIDFNARDAMMPKFN